MQDDLLLEMTGYELGHFKHANLLLAIEHGFERVVGIDEGPFLGILEFVLLDVIPELLGELRAREWLRANYFGEFCTRLNWLQECCVWFSFCGFRCFCGFGRFCHDLTSYRNIGLSATGIATRVTIMKSCKCKIIIDT